MSITQKPAEPDRLKRRGAIFQGSEALVECVLAAMVHSDMTGTREDEFLSDENSPSARTRPPRIDNCGAGLMSRIRKAEYLECEDEDMDSNKKRRKLSDREEGLVGGLMAGCDLGDGDDCGKRRKQRGMQVESSNSTGFSSAGSHQPFSFGGSSAFQPQSQSQPNWPQFNFFQQSPGSTSPHNGSNEALSSGSHPASPILAFGGAASASQNASPVFSFKPRPSPEVELLQAGSPSDASADQRQPSSPEISMSSPENPVPDPVQPSGPRSAGATEKVADMAEANSNDMFSRTESGIKRTNSPKDDYDTEPRRPRRFE